MGSNRKINYLYNAVGQKVKKTVNDGLARSITDYMGGYQYRAERKENSQWLFLANEPAGVVEVLQFFPTAEGYVKNTVVGGANSYDYVFNYTDHLGNVRLSYGIDPNTQQLTKFEENNYYPFGLKHRNYNYSLKEIQEKKETIILQAEVLATEFAAAIPEITEEFFEKESVQKEEAFFETQAALKNATPSGGVPIGDVELVANSGYLFKFQERQDELGLNWDSFKWRNYDPTIGRFMNIDPLTEEYHNWSPYVFSGNQVVHSRELEGLEPENDLNKAPAFDGYSLQQSDMTSGDPWGGAIKECIVYGISKSIERESPDLDNNNNNESTEYSGIFSGQLEYYAKYAPDGPNPYSPSCDESIPLTLIAIASAPFALEAGVAAASIGMVTNVFSQYVANQGDVGKINWIEAGSSTIPKLGSAIIGDSFSYSFTNGFQPPKLNWTTFSSVSGGVISHEFGKATDKLLFDEGFGGKVIGDFFKFQLETLTNVIPTLIK